MRGRCAAPARPQYAPFGGRCMNNQTNRAPAQAGAHHQVSPNGAAFAARAGDGPLPAQGRGDECRRDWTREEIAELFDLPFDELMWEAQGVHRRRSEEHTSELQSLMRISYAVFCLKKKKTCQQ